MLDVAQNTARLNVLINAYYTAEYELETKTESKLQLTQGSSQATIDNQKQTMALRDKFNALEDSLDAGKTNVNVDGVTIESMDKTDRPSRENFLNQWGCEGGGVHPKPQNGKGEFKPVNTSSQGFTLSEIKSTYSTKLNSDAKAAVGAEPSQGDYTKEVETGEKDENGNPITKTVDDTDAYNKAMAKWQADVQAKTNELAKTMQDQLINAKNNEINEAFQKADAQWQADRTNAGLLYDAACAKADGDTKAFTRAKQKAEDEQQLAFDQSQHDLSVQESMLDQQIQKLQAEVTALKTEIDSLKQERNSNVQSDFKLFG